jgi:hypothetical protein
MLSSGVDGGTSSEVLGGDAWLCSVTAALESGVVAGYGISCMLGALRIPFDPELDAAAVVGRSAWALCSTW